MVVGGAGGGGGEGGCGDGERKSPAEDNQRKSCESPARKGKPREREKERFGGGCDGGRMNE